MELRPYQKDCLDIIKEKYLQGVNKQLCSLPTGSGKTFIFSQIPSYLNLTGKVIVLAHREELLDQAANHFENHFDEDLIGIEKGITKTNEDHQIIVASVQTLGRANSTRLQKFNPDEFSAVIIDESHHSVNDTYERILKYFQVSKKGDVHSNKLLIGFTATVNRPDNIGLDTVFDELVYEYPILSAIKDKYLVDIVAERIYTKVNLDGVQKRAGDFAINQLEETINISERNNLIVDSWIKLGENRKTLVFCADVAHAIDLATCFKHKDIHAEAIWGSDPDRTSKFEDYRNNKFKVLTNCQIATEGLDIPDINCILMARPILSSLLFIQCMGRGLRTAPNKENCKIIDVTDTTLRHSLMTTPKLFGLPLNLDITKKPVSQSYQEYTDAQQANPTVDFSQMKSLDEIPHLVEKVDLFNIKLDEEVKQNSKLSWFKINDNAFFLSLPEKQKVLIKTNILNQYEIICTFVNKQIKEVTGLLSHAFTLAERLIDKYCGAWMSKMLRQDAPWKQKEPSQKQIDLARKLLRPNEIDKFESDILNNKVSKGQLADFITERFNKKYNSKL